MFLIRYPCKDKHNTRGGIKKYKERNEAKEK